MYWRNLDSIDLSCVAAHFRLTEPVLFAFKVNIDSYFDLVIYSPRRY